MKKRTISDHAFALFERLVGQLVGEGPSVRQGQEEAPDSNKLEMPVRLDTLACDLVKDDFRGDVVLFFDIDGVLHPYQTETLEFKAQILALVDKYPDLELIMCSNWRETVDQLWFEERLGDQLSKHFKGCTPLLSGGDYRRQREVELFCRHFQVNRYAVVDDVKELYCKGYLPLVLTDPATGLTDAIIRELVTALSPVHLDATKEL